MCVCILVRCVCSVLANRDLLRWMADVTRVAGHLMVSISDGARDVMDRMEESGSMGWLQVGAVLCSVYASLVLYDLAWLYLWMGLSKWLRCVAVCTVADGVAVC